VIHENDAGDGGDCHDAHSNFCAGYIHSALLTRLSGAATGSSKALQIDVHSEEGWYASGLEAGEATYANRVEKEHGGIWLWMTGHLRWQHVTEWALKTTRQPFACHEIGFEPLEKASNPF
jgi:hypothetical protein